MSLAAVVAIGYYGKVCSLRPFKNRHNNLNIQYSIENIQSFKDLAALANQALVGVLVLCIFQALLHRSNDILVAGAAAEVAGVSPPDLFTRNLAALVLLYKSGGGHYQSGCAEAALHGTLIQIGLLQRG